MRKTRLKLVEALAECVDSLCSGVALIDAAGAISSAIECDDRIWEFLTEDTKNVLVHGLGYIEP